MKTEDMTEDQQDELRDRFAAAALQGYITAFAEAIEDYDKLATWSYDAADAMMNAR